MSDFTIVVRSRLHGQPTAVQQEWLERGSEAPGEWRGHVLLGFLFSTYKSFAFSKAFPVGGEEHQGLPKNNSGPWSLSGGGYKTFLQDGILVELRKNKDLARAKWGVDHWKELII